MRSHTSGPARGGEYGGVMARSAAPRDVPIGGDMIRLGQFLKLADLIDTGGEAKEVIGSGLVTVNDEVEYRRGRQLHDGDVVALDGNAARVRP